MSNEHDRRKRDEDRWRPEFEREEQIARWGGGLFWGVGIWLILGLLVLAVDRCIG